MNRRNAFLAVGATILWLSLAPSAFAQSSIAGTVKDESGAVVPGVTVEASSPALIEQTRTAVTDGNGQYRIVDLRPGVYSVTFSLSGFGTVKRDGLELPANFTAQANAVLKTGGVEETVTVTGESPTVDLQNALVQQVVSREVLDSIPTGRTYQSVAQTTPGIMLDRPDVGGSEGIFATNLSVHGSGISDQTFLVDGMDISDGESDGRYTGMYRDDGDNQEIVYQTSAINAESSKGGVVVNMIGRTGGNQFHGVVFSGYTPGTLQSSNITPAIVNAGLPTTETMRRGYDYNFTLGGPIRRDKMWFFSSTRIWGFDKYAAGAFNDDGSRASDDNIMVASSLRLTTQATPKNKMQLWYARQVKRTLYNRGVGPTVTPDASTLHTTPIGHNIMAKWTSTATNKLLIDAGWVLTFVHPKLWPQPAAIESGAIPKRDLTTGVAFDAAANKTDFYDEKWSVQSSVAYVTGTHSIKTGVQFGRPIYRVTVDNGGLRQTYQNGVPVSVTVYNTPLDHTDLVADFGAYAQDAWTIKRLTVNYGLRFEYFKGMMKEQSLPAGRFVPARHFAAIDDVPNWKNWTPRLGVVYDLFGDGKTAIKASVNKYMVGQSVSFTENYLPISTLTDERTWTDSNHDNIAQDSEIGPSNISNFGTTRVNTIEPGLKRPYQVEYNVGIQRELLPRMSLTAGYFRRQYFDLLYTNNVALTASDYAPIDIRNPLDGSTVTIYNLDPAKRGAVQNVDMTSPNNTNVYNGAEFSVNGRPGKALVFGGMTFGRRTANNCDGPFNGYNYPDPNRLRFCDSTPYAPWQTQVKITGSYPLPWNLRVSGTFQSNPGNPITAGLGGVRTNPELGLSETYNVTRAVVPRLTQTILAVNLLTPATNYLSRVNQFDARIGRRFDVSGRHLDVSLDMFNLLNSAPIMRVNETFGSSYNRPLEVLQARTVRLTANFQF